jgi:hypothetical protein
MRLVEYILVQRVLRPAEAVERLVESFPSIYHMSLVLLLRALPTILGYITITAR